MKTKESQNEAMIYCRTATVTGPDFDRQHTALYEDSAPSRCKRTPPPTGIWCRPRRPTRAEEDSGTPAHSISQVRHRAGLDCHR